MWAGKTLHVIATMNEKARQFLDMVQEHFRFTSKGELLGDDDLSRSMWNTEKGHSMLHMGGSILKYGDLVAMGTNATEMAHKRIKCTQKNTNHHADELPAQMLRRQVDIACSQLLQSAHGFKLPVGQQETTHEDQGRRLQPFVRAEDGLLFTMKKEAEAMDWSPDGRNVFWCVSGRRESGPLKHLPYKVAAMMLESFVQEMAAYGETLARLVPGLPEMDSGQIHAQVADQDQPELMMFLLDLCNSIQCTRGVGRVALATGLTITAASPDSAMKGAQTLRAWPTQDVRHRSYVFTMPPSTRPHGFHIDDPDNLWIGQVLAFLKVLMCCVC